MTTEILIIGKSDITRSGADLRFYSGEGVGIALI